MKAHGGYVFFGEIDVRNLSSLNEAVVLQEIEDAILDGIMTEVIDANDPRLGGRLTFLEVASRQRSRGVVDRWIPVVREPDPREEDGGAEQLTIDAG